MPLSFPIPPPRTWTSSASTSVASWTTLAAFGRELTTLASDPSGVVWMGQAAREHVGQHYLPRHHFAAEPRLLSRLLAK